MLQYFIYELMTFCTANCFCECVCICVRAFWNQEIKVLPKREQGTLKKNFVMTHIVDIIEHIMTNIIKHVLIKSAYQESWLN